MQLERRGVRSAHVATARFSAIANAVAKAQHQPDHPIVVLPADTNSMSPEELYAQADHVLAVVFDLPMSPKE